MTALRSSSRLSDAVFDVSVEGGEVLYLTRALTSVRWLQPQRRATLSPSVESGWNGPFDASEPALAGDFSLRLSHTLAVPPLCCAVKRLMTIDLAPIQQVKQFSVELLEPTTPARTATLVGSNVLILAAANMLFPTSQVFHPNRRFARSRGELRDEAYANLRL